MNFELDDRSRALVEAGADLGRRCKALNPAQAGEDWRAAGAKELLRAASVFNVALFLDAYAAARGSVRAARVHADDVIARSPVVLEAALLAGAVQGLLAEVVENVRLEPGTRPDKFPTERDPDVRHAIADARTWSALARNLAQRAAWAVDTGTPSADVKSAPPAALVAACDAVLKTWPSLSRLLIGEDAYQRAETDVFRVAAKARPGAMVAVAVSVLGELPSKREGTVTGQGVA